MPMPRPTDADIAAARLRLPRAFGEPLPKRMLRWAVWFALIAWIVACCVWFDITPQRLASGLGNLGVIVGLMIPPAPGEHWDEIARALAETVAMAFLGTFVAAILAVPLGFLGAGNVVTNWLFHFSLRRVFDGFRGVDQLIWALVFVRAVGLGPLAGVMAIAVADVAVLAKLYAEAIENAEKRQVEGLKAAGARSSLTIRFGLLPQVFPVMLAQALYFVESNTRSASVLGIVGAGGIGLSIAERIRIRAWDEVAFIIILLLVTVAVIDLLSARIREKLIGRREGVAVR
jgi:phosphonate transport system permease protein